MSNRIITHQLAHEEFLNAVAWYEDQLPGLGTRFLEKVKQKLSQIESHPENFGKIQGELRTAKVDKFPYAIVFEFLPRKKVIHISSIYHSKRNPRKKFRRLK
ncbi:MAG: type II toxin-antitoxin system RelE/ParE family toxin [Chitinophagaceae bacterium]